MDGSKLVLGVNWMWGWGNSPYFYVFGSPPKVDWRSIRHERVGNCWRGQQEYQVHYLSHNNDGKNHGGYGGSVFQLLDAAGKPVQLGGPWSGSAAWCNAHFSEKDKCIEVVILEPEMSSGLACNFTEAKIIELWREAKGVVNQTVRESASLNKPQEWTMAPLRLGYGKCSWRDSISLIPLGPDGKFKEGCSGVVVLEELSL